MASCVVRTSPTVCINGQEQPNLSYLEPSAVFYDGRTVQQATDAVEKREQLNTYASKDEIDVLSKAYGFTVVPTGHGVRLAAPNTKLLDFSKYR